MRVILGGTFDHLHKGHEKLLDLAFAVGDYVYIGLTTDGYVRRAKPGRIISSYETRRRELKRFAESKGRSFDIVPLEDRFGPSISGDFDAIVVSEETFPVAEEINRLRKRNGLKSLRIILVGHVLAEDRLPISSERISLGEIDREGRVTKEKE